MIYYKENLTKDFLYLTYINFCVDVIHLGIYVRLHFRSLKYRGSPHLLDPKPRVEQPCWPKSLFQLPLRICFHWRTCWNTVPCLNLTGTFFQMRVLANQSSLAGILFSIFKVLWQSLWQQGIFRELCWSVIK